MSNDNKNTVGTEPTTLRELVDAGRLPSGVEFELMPDTIEVALGVAEANAVSKWQEKSAQVLAVVKTIDGKDVREAGGLNYINQLPDVDVAFIALAWTASVSDYSISLSESVPCPNCASPINNIDLGPLEVFAYRDRPSPFPMYRIDVDDRHLPDLYKENGLFVTCPTWMSARSRVADLHWSNMQVIAARRVMSAMHAGMASGSPRQLADAEAKRLPTACMRAATVCMKFHVPHIPEVIRVTCPICKSEISAPFDQGM